MNSIASSTTLGQGLESTPTKTVDIEYHDWLPANTEEERRLKVQHEVIHRTLGNILVQVPVDLHAPNTAILESGTGSGIWLLDLARTVPGNIELVGIDIQQNIFPPKSSIPRNLTFQVTSILDLPHEWTDKFTLIHQRLLTVAFNRSQWVQVYNNMYRSLKPGIGWVQLFEVDKWVRAGPELDKFTEMWKIMFESRGIYGTWPNGSKIWKQLVKEAGFVDIQVRWYETPLGEWAGRDGIDMRENLAGLMNAARTAAIQNDNFGILRGGAEAYDEWMKDVIKEVDEGVTEPGMRWVMICARKPSA